MSRPKWVHLTISLLAGAITFLLLFYFLGKNDKIFNTKKITERIDSTITIRRDSLFDDYLKNTIVYKRSMDH